MYRDDVHCQTSSEPIGERRETDKEDGGDGKFAFLCFLPRSYDDADVEIIICWERILLLFQPLSLFSLMDRPENVTRAFSSKKKLGNKINFADTSAYAHSEKTRRRNE
jgi:hypothetical protein